MKKKKDFRLTAAVDTPTYQAYRELADALGVSMSQAIGLHLDLSRDLALELAEYATEYQEHLKEKYREEVEQRVGFLIDTKPRQ